MFLKRKTKTKWAAYWSRSGAKLLTFWLNILILLIKILYSIKYQKKNYKKESSINRQWRHLDNQEESIAWQNEDHKCLGNWVFSFLFLWLANVKHSQTNTSILIMLGNINSPLITKGNALPTVCNCYKWSIWCDG